MSLADTILAELNDSPDRESNIARSSSNSCGGPDRGYSERLSIFSNP